MSIAFDRTSRFAAEAVGTAFLLAAIVGSGIMAERLAGGNIAVALLCNTIPTGAILYVLITMLGPVSGAHFNPAVTLVMRLRGELSNSDALAYVALQVASGIIGVLVAHAMFELPILQISAKIRTGPAQWLAEGIATFGLLLTILITVRVKAEAVASCVALYITSAYWFTASTSFANPAVTIARSLSDTFAGIAPSGVVQFIAAQLLGALAAMAAARLILGPSARRDNAGRPSAGVRAGQPVL